MNQNILVTLFSFDLLKRNYLKESFVCEIDYTGRAVSF